MNNMRRGFTMIELVFVIVIIGILAAVALPRFTGISDDAHVAKLESFVGTLNRTVGPTMWSQVQRKEPTLNGSVANSTTITYDGEITVGETAIPTELVGPDGTTALNGVIALDTICLPSSNDVNTSVIGTGTIATAVIGGTTYNLGCIDSDLAESPRFWLDDGALIIKK